MFARYFYANADLQRRQQLRWLREEVKEASCSPPRSPTHIAYVMLVQSRDLCSCSAGWPAKWLGQPLAMPSL